MQRPVKHSIRARVAKGACLLLAVLMLVVHFPAAGERAYAQETRSTGGLFQLLFGKRKRDDSASKKDRIQRSNRRKSVQRAPAEPAKPKVEKLENARKVLVVGDFMAGGMAEGLETAFAELPGVVVIDRSSGSSGLVRDDYYNWPESIGPMIEEENPAVVVIMIGANDRQQLVVDGVKTAVRSEPWTKEYERRIESLAQAVASRKIPFVWLGALPFRFTTMTADMLAFNDHYKQATKNAGGEFVDAWEGFVDENGAFATTGPDINGQAVRLRAGDGINLTKAGRRKIAFYAEKPLRRILGDAALPDIARLSPDFMPDFTPEVSPDGTAPAKVRTVPISLNDPELDGGSELLGRVVMPERKLPENPLAAERLAIEGVAPPPNPGRADDFQRRQANTPPPDGDESPASSGHESRQ